ncbi:FkbM family methyltransferase [Ilumatobacter sp.]|uniref:FkbM family methyltransferase n=1 Tax=Ilumatobacter sp. TaxID=1967498 RepID=UPI003B52A9F8
MDLDTTTDDTAPSDDGPGSRLESWTADARVTADHLRTVARRRYFELREKVVGPTPHPHTAQGPLPAYGETIEVDGITMRIDERMSEFNIRKLMAGRHTIHERALVVDRLRPDDVVMELGSGIGMVSTACAMAIGSAAVHAYEANPELESLIRDNYELNGVSPTLNMVMLGERRGTRTFHLAERFSHSSAQLAGDTTRPVEVPVEPADEHLAATGATVLVVDIQGGEVEFFDFADLSRVRLVLVELHPFIIGLTGVRSVRRRLRELGFDVVAREASCYLLERTAAT